jgi:LuxR family maltose regulon positive regulatory protein
MATADIARRARVKERAQAARAGRERGRDEESLDSRLTPPRRRPGTITRTGLVNRLRVSHAAPVVVVTAPHGYGKTTLVAEWARRDGRPFAWYALDRADGPDDFAANLAEAVSHVVDGRVSPGGPDETAARLGRALASSSTPVVVVLDDVDHLRDAASIRLVERLVGELPGGSQLALVGTCEPPLPLARLRSQGQLFEIGAADLQFGAREAAALLHGAGCALAYAAVEALNARVEGWPAGLALAASDPVGSSAMLEYLRAEVLAPLRDDDVRFLARVSVLERLCGPLCDVVADATDSWMRLERLERSNAFLFPLDQERRWYRLHSVFRELLRSELARREPGLEPSLRSRASAWCAVHGDPELALDYAREAGDLEQLTALLERSTLPFAGPSRPARVERWLGPFDDDAVLDRHPAVAAMGALTWAMTGHPDAAERWADAAERGAAVPRCRGAQAKPAAPTPWPALLRSLMCPSDAEEMRTNAQSALDALPAGSAWRAPVLAVLGSAHALEGDASNAESIFREAADTAASAGAPATESVALAGRSLLATERGDWGRADALAEAAVETVRASRLDGSVTSLFAFAAAARAALRRGDWASVHANLERADELLPQLSYAIGGFAVSVRIEFARVRLALGDAEGVVRLLDEVDAIFARRPKLGVLREDAVEIRARVEAQNGRAAGRMSTLTAAELRLLPLLATHLSFREIAERLYVSRNTVKTQAISVYRKLGVSSRGEAIGRATDLGLVAGETPAAA